MSNDSAEAEHTAQQPLFDQNNQTLQVLFDNNQQATQTLFQSMSDSIACEMTKITDCVAKNLALMTEKLSDIASASQLSATEPSGSMHVAHNVNNFTGKQPELPVHNVENSTGQQHP